MRTRPRRPPAPTGLPTTTTIASTPPTPGQPPTATVGDAGPSPATGAVAGAAPADTPLAALPTDPPAAPAVPSSLDKLEAAEQAGTLDPDTGLLYRLYAYFDRAQIPAEYLGEDRALADEPDDILTEIADRLDAMKPEVRDRVTPFLLRPGEADSFWNRPPAATPAAPTLAYQAAGVRAQAATPLPVPLVWASGDSANTNTRVWYPTPAPGTVLTYDFTPEKLAFAVLRDVPLGDYTARATLVQADGGTTPLYVASRIADGTFGGPAIQDAAPVVFTPERMGGFGTSLVKLHSLRQKEDGTP